MVYFEMSESVIILVEVPHSHSGHLSNDSVNIEFAFYCFISTFYLLEFVVLMTSGRVCCGLFCSGFCCISCLFVEFSAIKSVLLMFADVTEYSYITTDLELTMPNSSTVEGIITIALTL